MKYHILTIALAVALIVGAGCSQDDSAVAQVSTTHFEWPNYGGTQRNERHAELM